MLRTELCPKPLLCAIDLRPISGDRQDPVSPGFTLSAQGDGHLWNPRTKIAFNLHEVRFYHIKICSSFIFSIYSSFIYNANRKHIYVLQRNTALFALLILINIFRMRDEKFQSVLSKEGNRTLTFVGTGEPAVCESMIRDQFDVRKCKATHLEHRTCFNSKRIARPSKSLKFYAFSTYWYLVQVLKVPESKASKGN